MEKMKWDKLSMQDRAFLIREAVRNGITDIDSIRDTWEHRFDGLQDVVKKVNTSDADFAVRLRQEGRASIPDWEDPRRIATHKLGVATDENGVHFIYPDVQNINNRLVDYSNPSNPHYNHGPQIAAERGDTIQIGNTRRDLRNAIKFTEKYKKLGLYPEFSTPPHTFSGEENLAFADPTGESEYIIDIPEVTITAQRPRLTSREDYKKLGEYTRALRRGEIDRENIPFKFRVHLPKSREQAQEVAYSNHKGQEQFNQIMKEKGWDTLEKAYGVGMSSAIALPVLSSIAGSTASAAAAPAEQATVQSSLSALEAANMSAGQLFMNSFFKPLFWSTVGGGLVDQTSRLVTGKPYGQALYDAIAPDSWKNNPYIQQYGPIVGDFLNLGYLWSGPSKAAVQKAKQLFGKKGTAKTSSKNTTYDNFVEEVIDDVASRPTNSDISKTKNISLDDIDPATLTDREWDMLYEKAIADNNLEEVQKLRDLHFVTKAPKTALVSEQTPLSLYHNTDNIFNAFDLDRIGSTNDPGFYGHGIYTTPNKTYASSYGENQMSLYGNLEKPFNTRGDLTRSAQSYNFGRDDSYSLVDLSDDIIKELADADGVIHTGSSYLRGGQPVEEVVFSNPTQLKLADAITYDDFGNVIPLSQRDNFTNPDLRYQKTLNVFEPSQQTRSYLTNREYTGNPSAIQPSQAYSLNGFIKKLQKGNYSQNDLELANNIQQLLHNGELYYLSDVLPGYTEQVLSDIYHQPWYKQRYTEQIKQSQPWLKSENAVQRELDRTLTKFKDNTSEVASYVTKKKVLDNISGLHAQDPDNFLIATLNEKYGHNYFDIFEEAPSAHEVIHASTGGGAKDPLEIIHAKNKAHMTPNNNSADAGLVVSAEEQRPRLLRLKAIKEHTAPQMTDEEFLQNIINYHNSPAGKEKPYASEIRQLLDNFDFEELVKGMKYVLSIATPVGTGIGLVQSSKKSKKK